ncbi:MAG: hypothetical protein EP329_09310 [Deltaproteobacteria bacterium]|nr:MAG: hypothetical protein EP329_09310 [Deltaproteobacteria bacterium]
MNASTRTTAVALALGLVLGACGDAREQADVVLPAPDVPDASEDSAAPDTLVPDTAAPEDTAEADTTPLVDAVEADTTPLVDAVEADVAPSDTHVPVEVPVEVPWTGVDPAAAPVVTWLGVLTHPDMESPHRIATSPSGRIAVTDPRRHAVHIFAPDGALVTSVVGVAEPLGCAFDGGGVLVVGDGEDGAVRGYAPDGTPLFTLDPPTPLGRPGELAWEPVAEQLLVVDAAERRVSVYDAGGSWLLDLPAAAGGDAPGFLSGLATAPDGQRTYVVDHDAGQVRVYDADGASVGAFGSFGADAGQLTRPQGIAVDPAGRVYVADAFQGRLQVFTADGTPLGAVGEYGEAPDQLLLASDATFDPYHRLLVTSYRAHAVVLYGVDGQSVTPPAQEVTP